MLYDAHEVEEGQVVFLFPHTRGASPACHEKRRVTIAQPPARFWPYLVVTWTEGGVDKWERVHRDNIKKKPTTPKVDKQEGDGAGGGRSDGKWQRKTVMPGKIAHIEDQMELF